MTLTGSGSEMGEKKFSGISSDGTRFSVTQYESPASSEEDAQVDPDSAQSGIDWVGTSTSEGQMNASENLLNQVEIPEQNMRPSLATAVSSSSLGLAWLAAPQTVEYRILRDGQLIQTTTTPAFSDTGLEASKLYQYQIISTQQPADANDPGQVSERSLEVTTLSATGAAPASSGPTDLSAL